ncbi:hypothetical protein [Arenibacter antarcticus]|uniref:Uncharacterized protein n=2 Tax=Flavobacteriaceae TaxID=49546 RepID=A0ABW5VAM0_9FLAO
MEFLEPIMRFMDNYPLISIAFCLLIGIGGIAHEVNKIMQKKINKPQV